MTSSLVSFARTDIHLEIPGLQVGDYFLPACKGNKGTILYVEDSYYYKPDLEGNQDRVAVSSEEIARSLVHMHITAQLAYKTDEQHPAFFAVPHTTVTPEMLESKLKAEVQKALSAQRRWFIALVKMADDDWQQLHRHNMVSDIQRIAARELGLKREWLMTVEDEQASSCPFCASQLLDPMAPICPTCGKVHNPHRLKELELKLSADKKPS